MPLWFAERVFVKAGRRCQAGQAKRVFPGLLVAAICLTCFASYASATDLAVLRNGFSIRHERREVIGPVTRLYLSKTDSAGYVDVPTNEIDRFEPDPTPQISQSSANLADVIHAVSNRYRLDPDLVNSVIRAESGFNARAVSPKGAQGLMQLMPQTAARLGIANAFNPGANVDGGTRYLRELLERYNFDLIKALAAYNAGPGRVEQYHGVPPYYETQVYVARIVRDFNRKKAAEHKTAAANGNVGRRPTPRRKSAPHLNTREQAASAGPALGSN